MASLFARPGDEDAAPTRLFGQQVLAATTAVLLGGLAGAVPFLRPGSASLVAVLAVVTVLAVVAVLEPVLTTLNRGAGRAVAPRVAALLAGAAAMARLDEAWLVAVITALTVLLVSAEGLVSQMVTVRVPWTAHLPGVADSSSRGPGDGLLCSLTVLAPLAAFLVVLLDGPVWWWLVGSGAYVLAVAVVVARGFLARLRAPLQQKRIARAIADYDAEFIVYTSRPDDASYQVAMWLPYLERTGRRYLVVARTQVAAEPLARLTDAPVVVMWSVRSLDALPTKNLGAVFYVNASSGNNVMVRYSRLTHVYLGHGDSDKPPSYNPTHAMYDRIFAAGQGAIDRYAAHGVHIDPAKFDIVGRPQVEGIRVVAPGAGVPAEPTVLYAPTWRGHVGATALQSLHLGEQIVTALLQRGARVIFRPHPFSYEFEQDAAAIERVQAILAADARTSGRAHVWGPAAEKDRSIVECVNESDAMVSDVSSVVSDYLYSGKPFAMMAISAPPGSFAAEYPVARAAYVVDADLERLPGVLDDMLGADPLAEQRRATRTYYLGDFPADGYAQGFVDAVHAAIDRVETTVTDDDAESEDEEALAPVDDDLDAEIVDAEDGVGARKDRGAMYESFSRFVRLAGTGKARLAVLPTLYSVVPAVALALALAGANRWVVGVACLVGVALLLLRMRGVRARAAARRPAEARLRSLVGTDGPAWFVVAAAAAVTAAAQGVGGGGFALLGLATAGAAGVMTLQRWRGVVAERLPGLRVGWNDVPATSAVASAVRMAVVVLGVVVAVLATADAAAWTVGAVAAAAVLVAFVAATRQAWASAQDADDLPALVERYAPQFEVYFAAATGAAYQYGMWEPYLQRIGRRFLIVSRNVPMGRELADSTAAPVVVRPTLRSLDDVDVPSLSTVFYVNNATKNTHMVERTGLVNVWLNHGDSEKPACFNPVHAIYHRIFAAGQAGIDRYARHGVRIPRENFRIVGRPQVEKILPARGPVGDLTERTVLYAPTWVGPYADTDVYSLPVGEELVRRLLRRDVRIVFRAHPLNYGKLEGTEFIERIHTILAADARETGRRHVWGEAAEVEMTVEDCFNASDAMVCDVSAVVSDYLQSGKPMAIMAMGRTVEEIETEVPAARAAYVVPGDLVGLEDRLDDLLGADLLAPARREMREYYLGPFPAETYADGFLDAARETIDAGRRA